MSEKLQRGRGLVDRFRVKLDEITGRFACGRTYEREGEEMVLETPDQEPCLVMQLTCPKHERMNIVGEDGIETVRRRPAVELTRIKGKATRSCIVNLGYTPGSTFFGIDKSVEVDLESKRLYLQKKHEKQPVLRSETAERILRSGIKIMEDKEVSMMDSSVVNKKGQIFRLKKIF